MKCNKFSIVSCILIETISHWHFNLYPYTIFIYFAETQVNVLLYWSKFYLKVMEFSIKLKLKCSMSYLSKLTCTFTSYIYNKIYLTFKILHFKSIFQRRDITVTQVLMFVVVIFLLCHSLKICLNLYELSLTIQGKYWTAPVNS